MSEELKPSCTLFLPERKGRHLHDRQQRIDALKADPVQCKVCGDFGSDCDECSAPPASAAAVSVPVELLERLIKCYEDGMSIYGECEELRTLLAQSE